MSFRCRHASFILLIQLVSGSLAPFPLVNSTTPTGLITPPSAGSAPTSHIQPTATSFTSLIATSVAKSSSTPLADDFVVGILPVKSSATPQDDFVVGILPVGSHVPLRPNTTLSNSTFSNGTAGGCQYWVKTHIFRWVTPVSNIASWAESTTSTPRTTAKPTYTLPEFNPGTDFSFELEYPEITVTAATQVVFVDRESNRTSTSIIRNKITPTKFPKGFETNSEGTRITRLTFTDSLKNTQFTTIITYPTPYLHYDYVYGQRPTPATDKNDVISGATTLAFPSRPNYPNPVATPKPNVDDPEGLFAMPKMVAGADLSGFYKTAFPDIPLFRQCSAVDPFVGGDGLGVQIGNDLTTILTVISTSFTVVPALAPAPTTSPGKRPGFHATESLTAAPLLQPGPSNVQLAPTDGGGTQAPIPKPTLSNNPVPVALGPSDMVSAIPETGPKNTDGPANAPGNSRMKGPSDNLEVTGGQAKQPMQTSIDIGSAIGSLLQPQNPQGASRLTATPQPVAVPVNGGSTRNDGFAGSKTAPAAGAPQGISPIRPTPTTIGSKSFDRIPITSLIIGTQTLVPGGSSAVIGEKSGRSTINIDQNGRTLLTVGTLVSTVVAPAPSVIPIGGQTATPIAGGLVFESKTLSSGGPPITLGQGAAATTISLNQAGETVVLVSGTSSKLATPAPSRIILGGQMATPATGGLVIGSQTLTSGRPITLGTGSTATTLSINPAGQTVVIAPSGTSTLTVPPSNTFTIGDNAVATALSNSYALVFGSQTLTPGAPITVSGTPVALQTNAAGSSILIIGTSTTTLPPITAAPTPPTISTTLISSGSSSITAYIVGSQTLYQGHPITLTGSNSQTTVLSISTNSAGNTVLVVGDKTTTLDAGATQKFITSEVLVTYVSTSTIAKAGTTRWSQRYTPSSGDAAPASATTSSRSGAGKARLGICWLGVIGLMGVVIGLG